MISNIARKISAHFGIASLVSVTHVQVSPKFNSKTFKMYVQVFLAVINHYVVVRSFEYMKNNCKMPQQQIRHDLLSFLLLWFYFSADIEDHKRNGTADSVSTRDRVHLDETHVGPEVFPTLDQQASR